MVGKAVDLAGKTELVKVKCARLDAGTSAALALVCAVQTRSIAMFYLDDKGELATFYAINDAIDKLWRYVKGKIDLDVERVGSSLGVAGRKIDVLESSDDEHGVLAVSALEISVLAMKHFVGVKPPPVFDSVLAACDLASQIAEAASEASATDSLSVLTDGDVAAEYAVDAVIEVLQYLDGVPEGQLSRHATALMRMAGPMNVRNGDLMRSLLHPEGGSLDGPK